VLVGQGPSFDFKDPAEYVYRRAHERARSKPGERINDELRTIPGYSAFFDPYRYLCPEGDCALTRDGQFLYYDGGHYSTYGSTLVADGLLAAIASSMR
jgi:hypothetical protein